MSCGIRRHAEGLFKIPIQSLINAIPRVDVYCISLSFVPVFSSNLDVHRVIFPVVVLKYNKTMASST